MSTRPSDNLYPIEEHPDFRGEVNRVKTEVRDFVQTRLLMLRSELQEKMSAYKTGVPMIAIGAGLLVASTVAANIAILALLAHLLGETALAWCYAGAIMFGCYAIVGTIIAYVGVRHVSKTGLVPTQTLKVLKQDQTWIQNEANTQL